MAAATQPDTPTTDPEPSPPIQQLWRVGVEQYHAMIAAGVFRSGDRIELLDGWLVRKVTKNPPHVVAASTLHSAVSRLLPDGWCARKEDPVTTGDSEPEPDLTIARVSLRDYGDRHPGAADVALVAEVADSSLQLDRTLKARIYARAGFAAYWIVNLPERRVEVYSDPTGPVGPAAYRSRRDFGEAEAVPLTIGGREIGRVAVRDLLP